MVDDAQKHAGDLNRAFCESLRPTSRTLRGLNGGGGADRRSRTLSPHGLSDACDVVRLAIERFLEDVPVKLADGKLKRELLPALERSLKRLVAPVVWLMHALPRIFGCLVFLRRPAKLYLYRLEKLC